MGNDGEETDKISILIIKLSAIGDVVHSLPVLSGLKRLFPQSRIDWLVEEAAAGLLQDHPYLNQVFISRRKSWIEDLKHGRLRSLKEFRDFVRRVRSERYDVILDLQNLFKSAFWVSVARGRRKLGFSGTRELAYVPLNEKIGPEDLSLHAVDRYLTFVQYLGGYDPNPHFLVPVTQAHRERAQTLLDKADLSEKKVVAVHPMALWPTKLWNKAAFSKLTQRLENELGVGVVFTGGAGDRSYVQEITAEVRPSPLVLCGRSTLLELAALYERCSVLVSTDTGPMHLAAAVGTPVVALFGPTAPGRTGPYGDSHVVVRTGISCSPCFKRHCSDPRCMDEITPDRVFEEVRKKLTLE